MGIVVVDGTGTYTVGGNIFRPGRTQCDDEQVLNIIRAETLDWVYLEEDDPFVEDDTASPEREEDTQSTEQSGAETPPAGPSADDEAPPVETEPAEAPDEEHPEPEPEKPEQEPGDVEPTPEPEPDPEQPEPTDAPEQPGDVRGEADEPHEDLTGESGPLTSADLEATNFPCRADDCEREFSTKQARATHERVKHPDLKE